VDRIVTGRLEEHRQRRRKGVVDQEFHQDAAMSGSSRSHTP
jgi:hypothetical protein